MAFNLGALAGGFSRGMRDTSRLWRETEDQNVRRQQREATQEAMGLMAEGPQEVSEYLPSTDPNRQAITTQLAEQTEGMFDDNDPAYQEMQAAEEELFRTSGGEVKSSVAHADFNKKLLSAAARSGNPNFFMAMQKKIDDDFNKKAKEYAYQGLIAAEQDDTDGMINAIRNYNGLLDNGIDLVATVKKDPKTGKDVVAVVFTDEETGEPLRGSRPQIFTATTAPNIFKVLATDDMYWRNKEAAMKERKYRLEERKARAQMAKWTAEAQKARRATKNERLKWAIDNYTDVLKLDPSMRDPAYMDYLVRIMESEAAGNPNLQNFLRATKPITDGGSDKPEPDRAGLVQEILSRIGGIGVSDTSGSSEPLMRSGYGEPAIPTPQDRAVPAQASPFNIDYTAKVERALDQGANINDIWALAKTPAQRQIIKRIALERNLYKGQN